MDTLGIYGECILEWGLRSLQDQREENSSPGPQKRIQTFGTGKTCLISPTIKKCNKKTEKKQSQSYDVTNEGKDKMEHTL